MNPNWTMDFNAWIPAKLTVSAVTRLVRWGGLTGLLDFSVFQSAVLNTKEHWV